jgi:hypothetical protein
MNLNRPALIIIDQQHEVVPDDAPLNGAEARATVPERNLQDQAAFGAGIMKAQDPRAIPG